MAARKATTRKAPAKKAPAKKAGTRKGRTGGAREKTYTADEAAEMFASALAKAKADSVDLVAPIEGEFGPLPMLYGAGRSGLKIQAGLVDEEFLSDLKGKKKDKAFHEMAWNSPVIGGSLWLIEALLRQVEWHFEPPDGKPGDSQRIADFFETCRKDMEHTWTDFVSETREMAIHGFAPFEITMKIRRGPDQPDFLRSSYDDGMIGWREFGIRSPDSRHEWIMDSRGKPVALIQRVETDPKQRIIPYSKLMNMRLRSYKQSPEGVSLLRHAYMPYFYWKKLQQIEAIGIERNMAGYPHFEAPIEAFQESSPNNRQVKALEDMAKKIRQHELAGIVTPASQDRNGATGWAFNLISASGQNRAESESIIQRYRGDQVIALLTQFMLLGQQSTGSWSLSSDQSSILTMALGTWLDTIAESVERTPVAMLGRMNDFPTAELPKLVHSDIEKADVLKTAQALQALASSGYIVPTDADEDHFRGQFELPGRQDGQPRSPAGAMPPPDPASQMDLFGGPGNPGE